VVNPEILAFIRGEAASSELEEQVITISAETV
jgi:hypothetical protein